MKLGFGIIMVVGIIVNYAELMYSFLEIFGLVQSNFYTIAGIPVVRIVFSNLSTLMFIIAFIIMIKRYNVK